MRRNWQYLAIQFLTGPCLLKRMLSKTSRLLLLTVFICTLNTIMVSATPVDIGTMIIEKTDEEAPCGGKGSGSCNDFSYQSFHVFQQFIGLSFPYSSP